MRAGQAIWGHGFPFEAGVNQDEWFAGRRKLLTQAADRLKRARPRWCN
jgi:hypothetical protein